MITTTMTTTTAKGYDNDFNYGHFGNDYNVCDYGDYDNDYNYDDYDYCRRLPRHKIIQKW